MNYFDSRVHLIEIKNFTRSISLLKDIEAIPEVKRIARAVKAVIIHFHSSKAGVIGHIALNGKKFRYSILLMDIVLSWKIIGQQKG